MHVFVASTSFVSTMHERVPGYSRYLRHLQYGVDQWQLIYYLFLGVAVALVHAAMPGIRNSKQKTIS